MWENQTDFDKYEQLFNHPAMDRVVDSEEKTKHQLYRILRLPDSPYFARIDFREQDETETRKVYIGKVSFWNVRSTYEIYDLRVPIASMYYEF